MPQSPTVLRRRRRRLLPVGLVLVALTFGACGGDDENTSPGESSTTTSTDVMPKADVTVIAEDIDFPTKAFTAKAGEITIAYKNEGLIRHTLVIEGADFDKLEVDAEGDIDAGTVELEAGAYTLFCDVPAHRGAGMEATLTVE
jgi:plastocyanin